MPFINVMTNSEIKDKDALKAELGNDITAIPGKSEAWLMVKFEEQAKNISAYRQTEHM